MHHYMLDLIVAQADFSRRDFKKLEAASILDALVIFIP